MSSVTVETIRERIVSVRGKKVILDYNLAELLSVQTSKLNERVRRLPGRVRVEEYFLLQPAELDILISKNKISKSHKVVNRRMPPLAYTLSGVENAAMLFGSTRAKMIIKYAETAFLRMITSFDYFNGTFREFQDYCKNFTAGLFPDEVSDELVNLKNKILEVMWSDFLTARRIKCPPDGENELSGWEILTMISDILAHNLTCPKWLLKAFNQRLDAVLTGPANSFGHNSSFGCCRKKRTMQRYKSGIYQNVVIIARMIIDKAPDEYKVSKDQLRPSQTKAASKRKPRKRKISVFDVMADYDRLIHVLMKYNIMTATDIAVNSDILTEISKSNSDTLFGMYYEEYQKFNLTF